MMSLKLMHHTAGKNMMTQLMPNFVPVYTAGANYFIFDAFSGNTFAANDDAENAAPVNAAVHDATKGNAATAKESHLSF